MHQRLIRYRTKPDQAAANEELIRAVYSELRHTSPEGLSYATFRPRSAPTASLPTSAAPGQQRPTIMVSPA
jgi:hypothetical protein